MSSRLNIDKDIVPGDTVSFELDMTLYGEGVSQQFTFTAPNAAPLVSRVSGVRAKINPIVTSKTGNNKNYSFVKYKKIGDLNANYYELLVKLSANKVPGDLAPDDVVKIQSSDATLGINNVNATVLKRNGARPNYLFLKVPAASPPTHTSGTYAVTNSTVTEVKKIIKKQDITVSLPKGFLNKLVAEKPRGTAEDGMMEDVVIYAYKQFTGRNTTAIKKKLMVNDDEVNDKIPPARSDIVAYRGKDSYSKLFTINDKNGQKVVCYIAIARYTYDGNNWNGEWVQTDSSDKVIWGKAK